MFCVPLLLLLSWGKFFPHFHARWGLKRLFREWEKIKVAVFMSMQFFGLIYSLIFISWMKVHLKMCHFSGNVDIFCTDCLLLGGNAVKSRSFFERQLKVFDGNLRVNGRRWNWNTLKLLELFVLFCEWIGWSGFCIIIFVLWSIFYLCHL